MRIVGIDPGLNRTGYGVIDSAATRSGQQRVVEGGVCTSRQEAERGERTPAERRVGARWGTMGRGT